jgi:mono/diheme cytochrome c family protein
MKFIVGLIVGLILIPLGVACYFVLGMAPVATSAQAMPFEKTLARIALDKRVEKEAPQTPPAGIAANDATYAAGAQVYRDNCAVCHGDATGKKTAIAAGMFPRPPQLLQGKGVSDDPPGETYWKAENGIRLTGMPAFKGALSEQQIWQVSLLLANSDKLPDSVKQQLSTPAAAK